MQVIKKL